MVLQSSATLENTIRTIFPEIWLRQLSIETCFIKRERKIKSEVMFWVLTLGFCVYNQHTIASLKRLYEMKANISISDSSWYDRFTPELVEFLHQCVIHGIEGLAKEPGRKLSKKLKNFQDVLIQDSTIVRLHSSLADKFPATRSRVPLQKILIFKQNFTSTETTIKNRVFFRERADFGSYSK